MNLVVRTYSGKVVTRPETTKKKEEDDLYLPEFVDWISASDTLFVRIERPGRSIAEKFAERHFDKWCRGMLLYAGNLMDGTPEGYASASCLDYTSIIPEFRNTKEQLDDGDLLLAAKAVAECSRYCFLRTGDIVAIETEKPVRLCGRPDGTYEIKEFKFNIIF